MDPNTNIDNLINLYEEEVIRSGLREEPPEEEPPAWTQMWEYITQEEEIWK